MSGQPNRREASGHAGRLRSTVAAFLTLGALGALFAAAIFAGFAALVRTGATQRFDEAVLQWIEVHRTPLLDHVMLEATTLGNAAVLAIVVAIAALFLWLTGHRWSVLLLLTGGVGGTLINTLLKYLIGRPRPDVVAALTDVMTPSFPSGHAMSSLILYGAIAYIVGRLEPTARMRRWTWTLAAVLIASIGTSRIYLGVHYPTDVLAGFIAGVGWLLFIAGGIAALERYQPSR
jgi:undecaprenyl-diphosphatase